MKIGICGGTFDPFHRGHMEPILSVRETMQWERVIFVPALMQPFKTERLTASPFHRFAMAVLATESSQGMWVSPIELERASVSYTVETLETLKTAFPDDTLDWIIGEDNVTTLGAWRNLSRIFELANFAVLTRPMAGASTESATPRDEQSLQELARAAGSYGVPVFTEPEERPSHGAIVIATNREVPISSTEVRNRLRAGESIAAFVDPRVHRYIEHNQLYSEGHT